MSPPRSHSRREILRGLAGAAAAVAAGPWVAGCSRSTAQEVVVYTSVDQPIAAKVVGDFEKRNAGTKVRLVTDTEATKSIGLATRLRAEQANPICHVWWGNEPFHTIALANDGFFSSLNLPVMGEIESAYKDDQMRWAGCGLRARVLAVGEGVGEITGSIEDLLDARFRGKIALARPTAGTTGGHVAALYAQWGESKADAFFRKLKDNGALLLGGNSDVAQQVGSGNLALGLTDNDDIHNASRNRGNLWQVVPDQAEGQIGTLTVPTTVAMVRHNSASASAAALAAYLLSEHVERLLMDEHFAAFSVRGATPGAVRSMRVSYDAVARLMATAPKRAADILDGRI